MDILIEASREPQYVAGSLVLPRNWLTERFPGGTLSVEGGKLRYTVSVALFTASLDYTLQDAHLRGIIKQYTLAPYADLLHWAKEYLEQTYPNIDIFATITHARRCEPSPVIGYYVRTKSFPAYFGDNGQVLRYLDYPLLSPEQQQRFCRYWRALLAETFLLGMQYGASDQWRSSASFFASIAGVEIPFYWPSLDENTDNEVYSLYWQRYLNDLQGKLT